MSSFYLQMVWLKFSNPFFSDSTKSIGMNENRYIINDTLGIVNSIEIIVSSMNFKENLDPIVNFIHDCIFPDRLKLADIALLHIE